MNRKESNQGITSENSDGRRQEMESERDSFISFHKNDIGNSCSLSSQNMTSESFEKLSLKEDEGQECVIEVDIPFKKAMKDVRTWIICCALFFSLIQGNMSGLLFKNYGLENIPNDVFITIVGTIGSIMNGLSRSFWGVLVDKYQYKYVYGTLLLVQAGLGFTMNLISSSRPLYLIWIGASFFCLGGNFSISPTILARIYGGKTGSKIYSFCFLFMVPAGFVSLILSKTLYNPIGYGKIYMIGGGTTLVSFFCILFFTENRKYRI